MGLQLVGGRLMPSCSASVVDIAGLHEGVRHRHRCEVLRQLCFWNGTLVPSRAGPEAERARLLASSLWVRSPFGSHQQFRLSHLHPMLPPDTGSATAVLLQQARLSRCTALFWVPVWAFSFADSFVSSLVPIDELQAAGLIDEHVQLRPDLHAWPRSKNPIYRMIAALSTEPTRTVREAAQKCSTARRGRRGCQPACYERVVVCHFRSTFDSYTPPMAPWRAAQRVAASVLRGKPVDAATAIADAAENRLIEDRLTGSQQSFGVRPLLRVVLVNRTRTKFSRSLTNMDQLLQVAWLAQVTCGRRMGKRCGYVRKGRVCLLTVGVCCAAALRRFAGFGGRQTRALLGARIWSRIAALRYPSSSISRRPRRNTWGASPLKPRLPTALRSLSTVAPLLPRLLGTYAHVYLHLNVFAW